MTISKVLDQTVRMYRANFVPLATLGAIHAFVSLPLIFLDGKPHGGMTLPQLMGMFAFVALVAMAVLLPWQSGAAISASLQILGGQPPQVGTSLGASWRRLGALIGLGILSGLAGGLGALLFVIPGFYIWFGFSFGGAVLMDQKRPGEQPIGTTDAMRRSWALAKGLRGRLFGVSLVWVLLMMVLQMAVSGILTMVGVDGVVRDLAKQLSGGLVTPCQSLSLVLLYAHARTQREGDDLAREAERLAGVAQPANAPAV
jgi:hypothetical protein